jgi:hypothetical protein
MSNTHSGDFVRGLQDAVRQNPVSAALIGMGVLWMFTGGSKITAAAALLSPAARATGTGTASGLQASANAAGAAGEGLRGATSRVADTVRETVADVAAAVGNTASQAYDTARGAVTDSASEIKDNFPDGTRAAAGMASTLQGNLKDTFERQPLLLGAIGLVLGAGMAAAVPPTQLETEYAGDAAEKVTAQVKEFASAQVDRVSAAAERTLEAVKDEAVAQGLTPQATKDGAVAVGEKLKTVAKAARSPTT